MPKDTPPNVIYGSLPVDRLWREDFYIVIQREGWTCENRHLDPETGKEFVNDGGRDRCEICTRPRPTV